MTWDTFDRALISFNLGMCAATWWDGAWNLGTSVLLGITVLLLVSVLVGPPVRVAAQQ